MREERKDKGGIFGFGILGGNRPQLLEKVSSKPATVTDQVAKGEFCRLLDAAIEDEEKADPEYATLAQKLYAIAVDKPHYHFDVSSTMEKDHATILGIRNQEIEHKRLLEGIKKRQCMFVKLS